MLRTKDSKTGPSDMSSQSPRLPIGEFPPPIVVSPRTTPHSLTIIFLHGRGFNAEKFHGPLLQTNIGNHTFQEALPQARFVFPTAPLSRATKYRRMLMHQWYDGTGDWEPEARGGMRPSIEYLHGLIQGEIELIGSDEGRVVLAGFSQGCAMALMAGLLWEGKPLGALVGLCGFIPLASHLLSILDSESSDAVDGEVLFGTEDDMSGPCGNRDSRTSHQLVLDELREEAEIQSKHDASDPQPSSMPVFLGHGQADPEVELRHASQAGSLLQMLDMDVEFHVYQGLGHEHSGEMLADFVKFLARHLDTRPATG
jgi:predicted esterase